MDDLNDRQKLYTDEARSERFRRIAERRTNKILNDIRLLGNTSNKTLYLYSEEDVQKIFGAIEARLSETKRKFRSRQFKEEFKL